MTSSAKDSSPIQFPVVGIGASAGGLEAAKLFINAIPPNSGMAYVFVQHLSPTHESALAEILAKDAKIRVFEVTHDIKLEPDIFYTIPSNKILTLVDGKLQLAPRNTKNKKIKIIDLFFSSLGVVHQSFAVGIILSGTLDDGTLGLKVIKANGGITFAQDDSAAYDGMPHNAIKSGVADFIMSPEQMARKLLEINKPFQDAVTTGESTPAEETSSPPSNDVEIYKQIITTLRLTKKVDFSNYKPTTLVRRIQRRMALTHSQLPSQYLTLLRERREEQTALFNDMLISVTEFFRDPKSFSVLCEKHLPELFIGKNSSNPLRIWVAGCATGEEAYSMGICIEEFLSQNAEQFSEAKIQIFATDLSEPSIAKARTGLYAESDLRGVSEERLARFFTKTDGMYRINKSIRENCVFAIHNLLKDAPFTKIDLISCRNVLIYLEPNVQKRIVTMFHHALNAKGILMLGKSEAIGKMTELFTQVNTQEKVFLKKEVANRYYMKVTSPRAEQRMRDDDTPVIIPKPKTIDVLKKAEELVLSKYTPAGVIVNENYDIIQFRGITENWLTSPAGTPSANLMKMAREGLSFEIRNILHQAKVTNSAIVKEGISLSVNGKQQYVKIEAVPIADIEEAHFLVLFQNTSVAELNTSTKSEKSDLTEHLQSRINDLEKELALNREGMRAITEDQEATNEELQSANEELLSGSEELQAVNEELETAKEELQSTNEELLSLNQELVDRYELLNKSQKYTEGIVATMRDAFIVLNNEYRIVKATSGFYKKFDLSKKQTEGKILFELLDNQWKIPSLKKFLDSISDENNNIFDFELSYEFPTIGLRSLILNGRQLESLDGNKMILLAIEDSTVQRQLAENMGQLKRANEELERSNLELEQFAGIASHDLQEPLRKIITFLNIIGETKLGVSEEARPYMQKILFSAKRMQNMIKDLLSFSKLTNIEHSFVPVDLNEIIKSILDDFELALHEKQVTVVSTNLPTVTGVPLYMNQLFYNLIHNAIKFTKKGKLSKLEIYSSELPKAETTRYKLAQTNRYVDIIVKDNGIGFDQQHAESIFQLFNRLHDRDEYPGSGIGLAVCRKIVLQHRGKIFVESKENEGTTFHVILPL